MFITVGLPCFNSGHTLPLAIQSVLDQTFRDWELLVVDDGSTDDLTATVLSRVTDSRIRVIRDSRNLGLPARLNQIAQLARGQWIARMDADDVMHPERLARQVCAAREGKWDVIVSNAYVIDDATCLVGGRRVPPLACTSADVILRNGPIHATMLARRQWLVDHPYRPELRRGQDLYFWATYIHAAAVTYLPERLYFIREDPRLDLAKYYRTLQHHRAVYRMSRHLCSSRTIVSALGASYLKEFLYRLVSSTPGGKALLSGTRTVPLSVAETLRARAVLSTLIANTSDWCLEEVRSS